MHCCLFLRHDLACYLEAMYTGFLCDIIYDVKAVVGLCFNSYWNTLRRIHGEAVGSIFNFHPK